MRTHVVHEEIDACLTPSTLGELEPGVRRLLTGQQLFVKQADGRWRPKGSAMGLAQSFETSQLQQTCAMPAGRKQQG